MPNRMLCYFLFRSCEALSYALPENRKNSLGATRRRYMYWIIINYGERRKHNSFQVVSDRNKGRVFGEGSLRHGRIVLHDCYDWFAFLTMPNGLTFLTMGSIHYLEPMKNDHKLQLKSAKISAARPIHHHRGVTQFETYALFYSLFQQKKTSQFVCPFVPLYFLFKNRQQTT